MFRGYLMQFGIILGVILCLSGRSYQNKTLSEVKSQETKLMEQYSNISETLEDLKEALALKENTLNMGAKNNMLLQLLVQKTFPDLGRQLYDAVRNGNIKRVTHLLEAGAPTEYEDLKNKNRPTHAASENSHFQILEILLNNEANPNVYNIDKNSPLHFAAMKNCAKCIEILLEKGADIESQNKWKATPIITAASYGSFDAIDVLLDMGANIDAVQQDKYSALHFAASKGFLEVTEILVRHDANVRLKNKHGKTPLAVATENKHYDVAYLLQQQLIKQSGS